MTPADEAIPGDLHASEAIALYLCCSADVDASGGIHVICCAEQGEDIFEIRYASLSVGSLRELWSSRDS